MAFDAYFLSAVLDEIRQKATGARVEKVHQPGRDTVILLLRTPLTLDHIQSGES